MNIEERIADIATTVLRGNFPLGEAIAKAIVAELRLTDRRMTEPDTRVLQIEGLIEDAAKLAEEFVDELERRSVAEHHADWLYVRLNQAAQCALELRKAL